jgi:glycosyltransferase involved in cell wall biosynthesis
VTRPTVSVVIPTYNHSPFIEEALASVFAQNEPVLEVIVVNDGSTDDTQWALERHRRRIRIVEQVNRGVAAARNAGAVVATGELIAFLDADDIWRSRKLELQVDRFAAEPALGLVHCGVEEVDRHGRWLCSRLDGVEGWVAHEMLLFRRPVILGGGSATVVPRAVFEKVGGFDESMSTSADWDLYYRIACRYPVGFVPQVLVRYRVHDGNMHLNVRAMASDMLRAYAKAFSEKDPILRELRRDAYSRLHAVLAGSFLKVGGYGDFLRHALKSVLLRPASLVYFAGYPVRRLRRAN